MANGIFYLEYIKKKSVRNIFETFWANSLYDPFPSQPKSVNKISEYPSSILLGTMDAYSKNSQPLA